MMHMKRLLPVFALLILSACSSAGGDNTDPLVGHWTFTQLTVNHPQSGGYASAPSLCIGDLDFHDNGTWDGWNICKFEDSAERSAVSFSGTWVKLSAHHYKANNGDYDIVLSKDGNIGVYGSTTTTNSKLIGHYEYGHMFKDVAVDRAEFQ